MEKMEIKNQGKMTSIIKDILNTSDYLLDCNKQIEIELNKVDLLSADTILTGTTTGEPCTIIDMLETIHSKLNRLSVINQNQLDFIRNII